MARIIADYLKKSTPKAVGSGFVSKLDYLARLVYNPTIF
jgi:hypothetical protein